MATITSANAAQAIVKLVAAQGLPAVVGNLVIGNLINREYEPTLSQSGDTVNVPIPPVLQANNVAEGGSVVPQNPNLGNAQIVLNQHAEATFVIPDVTAALVGAERGDYSLLNKYLTPAMIAVAEKVETDLLNLYPNFTVNTAVGTGGVAITENVVDAAEGALFDAKVPMAMQKHLITSSQAYRDLRQTARCSEERTVGSGEAIVTGTIGKLKDFNVYRSQFVPVVGGTTYNLAFVKDAIGLVIRRLPQPLPGTGAIAEYGEMGNFGFRIVMSYQPNTLSQQFTVDMLYGAGVLRNSFGLQVRS